MTARLEDEQHRYSMEVMRTIWVEGFLEHIL